MKAFSIIIFSVFSLSIISCDKNKISDVADVDFNVSVAKNIYNVGDTIVFNFSGNPDFITFYSGEVGHRYANINRVQIDNGKPTLDFTSYAQIVGTQDSSLRLLASTDFPGVYDTLNENLLNATWVDLTDKVTLSSGAQNTASGTLDLSSIDPDKKTIYFAFRKHDHNSSTLLPWAWTIQSFNINLYSPEDSSTYVITDLADAGWVATDIANSSYKWAITSTTLTIGGGGLNTPENDDWVVTSPLDIYSVTPDVGVAIKSIDARLSSYSYSFSQAGTYKVSFLAVNQNVNTKKEALKELTITVQ
ncbi:MAG: DUF5017 domain-containing protein [Arachidicoccus sp.]|nr:DUF5017 domain-containing protein [Arachidicoccus sp.]